MNIVIIWIIPKASQLVSLLPTLSFQSILHTAARGEIKVRSCRSSARRILMAFLSFKVKSKVFIILLPPQDLPNPTHCSPRAPCSPATLAFLLFLEHARHAPPPGLTTSCSLCLDGSPSLDLHQAHAFASFTSLLRCHSLSNTFPDAPQGKPHFP